MCVVRAIFKVTATQTFNPLSPSLSHTQLLPALNIRWQFNPRSWCYSVLRLQPLQALHLLPFGFGGESPVKYGRVLRTQKKWTNWNKTRTKENVWISSSTGKTALLFQKGKKHIIFPRYHSRFPLHLILHPPPPKGSSNPTETDNPGNAAGDFQ